MGTDQRMGQNTEQTGTFRDVAVLFNGNYH